MVFISTEFFRGYFPFKCILEWEEQKQKTLGECKTLRNLEIYHEQFFNCFFQLCLSKSKVLITLVFEYFCENSNVIVFSCQPSDCMNYRWGLLDDYGLCEKVIYILCQ